MAQMTDEEAKRLDEKWTKNPPKPGPNGTGTHRSISVVTLISVQKVRECS